MSSVKSSRASRVERRRARVRGAHNQRCECMRCGVQYRGRPGCPKCGSVPFPGFRLGFCPSCLGDDALLDYGCADCP